MHAADLAVLSEPPLPRRGVDPVVTARTLRSGDAKEELLPEVAAYARNRTTDPLHDVEYARTYLSGPLCA